MNYVSLVKGLVASLDKITDIEKESNQDLWAEKEVLEADVFETLRYIA